MPPISFILLPLRDSFFHNGRGIPTTPFHLFPISPLVTRHSFTPSATSEGPLSLLFAIHPEKSPVNPLLATHPKNGGGGGYFVNQTSSTGGIYPHLVGSLCQGRVRQDVYDERVCG